ncbi:MAG: DUF1501 domain-containing protein, partial [Isosphaeraceae bacterium]
MAGTDSGDRRGCFGFRRQHPTRRDALRAGALTAAGLGLPGLFQGRTLAAERSGPAGFGRAKSCILIFMWGGPSQLETWDPKPEAPSEIRGSFGAIPTRTPGLIIGENFPQLTQQTHRLAVIKSMTHDDAAHLSTAHRLLTGHVAPREKSDADGPSPNDWPFLGSMVAKVRPPHRALPPSVLMPWSVAHPAAPGGKAPGQHGGWLGKGYDPFRIEGDPNAPDFQVGGLGLPEGITDHRMQDRRALLTGLGSNPDFAGRATAAWDSMQSKALDALASAEARGAFQIEREDPKV